MPLTDKGEEDSCTFTYMTMINMTIAGAENIFISFVDLQESWNKKLLPSLRILYFLRT